MAFSTAVLRVLRSRPSAVLLAVAVAALALPLTAAASPVPAVLTLKTVKVGAPGNPSVGDRPVHRRRLSVLRRCAPRATPRLPARSAGSATATGSASSRSPSSNGSTFLNTADPTGRDPHHLYDTTESSTAWPKYGQINFSAGAASGRHYSVAYPRMGRQAVRLRHLPADGSLRQLALQRAAALQAGQQRRRLQLRHLQGAALAADRARDVRPGPQAGDDAHPQVRLRRAEPERVDQGRLLRPQRRRHVLLLEVPDQPGSLRRRRRDRSQPDDTRPATGDVTNAATQPLATYHASGQPAPSWCPAQVAAEHCSTRQPVRPRPHHLRRGLPRQPRHGRPGDDHLALGDARPGRQRGRVDRHDHGAARRADGGRGMAAAARRDRQRARLPAVALGGRAAAAGQRVLRPPIRGSGSGSA